MKKKQNDKNIDRQLKPGFCKNTQHFVTEPQH